MYGVYPNIMFSDLATKKMYAKNVNTIYIINIVLINKKQYVKYFMHLIMFLLEVFTQISVVVVK